MPIAAAAPEVLAVLVLGLLLIWLVVVVSAYQVSGTGRAIVVDWPLIGQQASNLIDTLRGAFTNAVGVVDQIISDALYNCVRAFGRLTVLAFNVAGATILFLIHDTAAKVASALALARLAVDVQIPGLNVRIRDLENLEGVVSQVVKAAIAGAIAVAVAGLEEELRVLRAQQASTASTIGIYRPLWNQLAAVPGGAAATIEQQRQQIAGLQAQVGVLERSLGQTQSGVSQLERTVGQQQALLNKLAALLTLAGAGAIVLDMVLRLGRNPCYCLTDGDFSDLPARVDSLELNQL